jgi:hypothetical protein
MCGKKLIKLVIKWNKLGINGINKESFHQLE